MSGKKGTTATILSTTATSGTSDRRVVKARLALI